MNQLDLFDELTFIDDDLILEAHETPVRRQILPFRGLRKAAVLVAAAMMLVVTVLATSADIPITQGISWGEMYSMVSYDWTGGDSLVHQEDRDAIEVNGKEYWYHLYSTHGRKRAVASMKLESGEMLEVVLEAYLLMPDGTLQYKAISKQNTGRAAVFMSNELDGKTAYILTIRASFYRMTETGERLLIQRWTNLLDERADVFTTSDGKIYWSEEPTEAQTILPEGSDVAVVIEDPDE